MGLPLITRNEYKAHAGIISANSDAQIDALIPRVSELIKNICRRSFVDYVNDPKVDYFEGGTSTFVLSEGPVLSLGILEYSKDYGLTWVEATEYTDYFVNRADSTLKSIGRDFPVLPNGYRVSYTCGYETLPEDLKLAVFDLVTYYIRNEGAVHSNRAPGANTVQIEYILTTGLPASIRRVLDLYTYTYC